MPLADTWNWHSPYQVMKYRDVINWFRVFETNWLVYSEMNNDMAIYLRVWLTLFPRPDRTVPCSVIRSLYWVNVERQVSVEALIVASYVCHYLLFSRYSDSVNEHINSILRWIRFAIIAHSLSVIIYRYRHDSRVQHGNRACGSQRI